MKKTIIATAGFIALGLGLVACGGAGGNDTGRAYMPDMYYSRAYEAYGYNNVEGEYDTLKNRNINYNGLPVAGTVAIGDNLPYRFTGDDSAQMRQAEALRNPLDTVALTKGYLREAERMYLINCGACHGQNLDGNGPLYNNGNGAYPAVPKNLMADDAKAMTDGHYYWVITNGIRSMGAYASQLTPEQRWWVIKYIRSKQGPTKPGTQASDSTGGGGASRTGAISADTAVKTN